MVSTTPSGLVTPPVAVDILWQKKLKWRRVYCQSESIFHHIREAWGSWTHHIHNQKKENNECLCESHFLLFLFGPASIPGHGATYFMIHLISVILILLVSQVILDPAKLTIYHCTWELIRNVSDQRYSISIATAILVVDPELCFSLQTLPFSQGQTCVAGWHLLLPCSCFIFSHRRFWPVLKVRTQCSYQL